MARFGVDGRGGFDACVAELYAQVDAGREAAGVRAQAGLVVGCGVAELHERELRGERARAVGDERAEARTGVEATEAQLRVGVGKLTSSRSAAKGLGSSHSESSRPPAMRRGPGERRVKSARRC